MAKITQKEKTFRRELFEQLITLSTSAFGFVAALAWNEAIQSFVKEYIQAYFPQSGVISKFLYALLISLLAVFIIYQLSRIASRFGAQK